MAKQAEEPTSLLLLPLVLILLFLPIGGTSAACSPCQNPCSPCQEHPKTWCVAKPSSDIATLQTNINYACSQPQVDCSVLQEGCPCFNPDNHMSHASVAMNLFYQANGRHELACDFAGSALIVTTNPSYGACVYG